jgi:cation diffusion facilitator CzcD-associated flavoprotein CzcO
MVRPDSNCVSVDRNLNHPQIGRVCQYLGQSFAPHFTPSYFPWDQRVCLLPNGDLMQVTKNLTFLLRCSSLFVEDLQAIKTNKAIVVTDHIAGQ